MVVLDNKYGNYQGCMHLVRINLLVQFIVFLN